LKKKTHNLSLKRTEEKKSARIDIIIEKVEKTNQNPGRDDIINRFDPLSKWLCRIRDMKTNCITSAVLKEGKFIRAYLL